MPITGLLLTLNEEPHLQRQAIAALQSRPELQLGTPTGQWLPIAAATDSDAQSRELHDWILVSPGVEFVDVVSVNFEEMESGYEQSTDATAYPAPSRKAGNSVAQV